MPDNSVDSRLFLSRNKIISVLRDIGLKLESESTDCQLTNGDESKSNPLDVLIDYISAYATNETSVRDIVSRIVDLCVFKGHDTPASLLEELVESCDHSTPSSAHAPKEMIQESGNSKRDLIMINDEEDGRSTPVSNAAHPVEKRDQKFMPDCDCSNLVIPLSDTDVDNETNGVKISRERIESHENGLSKPLKTDSDELRNALRNKMKLLELEKQKLEIKQKLAMVSGSLSNSNSENDRIHQTRAVSSDTESLQSVDDPQSDSDLRFKILKNNERANFIQNRIAENMQKMVELRTELKRLEVDTAKLNNELGTVENESRLLKLKLIMPQISSKQNNRKRMYSSDPESTVHTKKPRLDESANDVSPVSEEKRVEPSKEPHVTETPETLQLDAEQDDTGEMTPECPVTQIKDQQLAQESTQNEISESCLTQSENYQRSESVDNESTLGSQESEDVDEKAQLSRNVRRKHRLREKKMLLPGLISNGSHSVNLSNLPVKYDSLVGSISTKTSVDVSSPISYKIDPFIPFCWNELDSNGVCPNPNCKRQHLRSL